MAIQPSHLIATGGVTSRLAGALEYLSHWPLQPLSVVQATNFAGLIVVGAGMLLSLRSRPFVKPDAPPAPPAAQ